MATTNPITIYFDERILNLIHQQAELNSQTSNEFMRNAILEKLEDNLDYQNAVKNIRESNDQTISCEDVKRRLGL